MNKNRIRLTEQDLHRIVKESVNRILVKEIDTNQEEYYEMKRSEMINKITAYFKQIETMLDQFRNEFGDESIEDDDYLTDIERFVSQLKYGF